MSAQRRELSFPHGLLESAASRLARDAKPDAIGGNYLAILEQHSGKRTLSTENGLELIDEYVDFDDDMSPITDAYVACCHPA